MPRPYISRWSKASSHIQIVLCSLLLTEEEENKKIPNPRHTYTRYIHISAALSYFIAGIFSFIAFYIAGPTEKKQVLAPNRPYHSENCILFFGAKNVSFVYTWRNNKNK